MRAFSAFPIAGTHQDLAVLLALLTMKLVNWHGGRIAGPGRISSPTRNDSDSLEPRFPELSGYSPQQKKVIWLNLSQWNVGSSRGHEAPLSSLKPPRGIAWSVQWKPWHDPSNSSCLRRGRSDRVGAGSESLVTSAATRFWMALVRGWNRLTQQT